MAAIHWTVGAQQDLREIVEYIGRDSVVYAASMAERLITAVEASGNTLNSGAWFLSTKTRRCENCSSGTIGLCIA